MSQPASTADRAPAVLGAVRKALASRTALAYYILVGLWMLAGFASKGFLSTGHVIYILELAAFLGVVGAGQTLVIVTGGIDLSVNTVITSTAIAEPFLAHLLPGPLGLLAILATAAAFGLVNGLGVTLLRIHPLVVTLATGTMLQGALLLFTNGTAVSGSDPIVTWMANASWLGLPIFLWIWLAIAGLTVFFLRRTVMGQWAYAIGTNPEASRLSAVNVRATLLTVYALCGLLAAGTGVMLLANNGQGYIGIGDVYQLNSIAAVVVGGTSIFGGRGGYLGTIAGSIILVTLTALITVVNASSAIRLISEGALILLLLTLYARERTR